MKIFHEPVRYFGIYISDKMTKTKEATISTVLTFQKERFEIRLNRIGCGKTSIMSIG